MVIGSVLYVVAVKWEPAMQDATNLSKLFTYTSSSSSSGRRYQGFRRSPTQLGCHIREMLIYGKTIKKGEIDLVDN